MKIQGKRIMSTKHKNTNKILLFLLFVIAFFASAVFIVPPMITLNSLKPKIEEAIFTKTGVKAEINGDVNFSLMGKTSIVAHNIIVPNGVISSIEFGFPLIDIFNIKNANISGGIHVNGANLHIEKIVPFTINNDIIVKNSNIKFLDKEYHIIDANFSKENSDALIRTNQHK